ncbi:MAG: hypothetical protein ACK4J0_03520 [Candidatus Anstonellaceae archaeon]
MLYRIKKTEKIKVKLPSLKEIVAKRIDDLIENAYKIAKRQPEYAIRYIKMARKIAMRNNVPITSKRKQLFCKRCNFPYLDGGFKIKKEKDFIIFLCLRCKNEYKIHKSKLIERYKENY